MGSPDVAAVVTPGARRAASFALYAVLVVAAIGGTWLLSQWNFLLFHTTAEIIYIVTVTIIFVFAFSVRRIATNGFLVVLGGGMAPLAAVLLLHALAYKGMNVLVPLIAPGDANVAAQLWLISRYLLAGALVAAPFFLTRRARLWVATVVAFTVSALLVASVLWWRTFPIAYAEGVGLTPFKVWSEYAVMVVFAAAAVQLWRRRDRTDAGFANLTLWAIGTLIASELLFTLYTDPYGLLPVLGHMVQIAGVVLLLLGIVRTIVSRPVALAFAELSASEARLARANRSLVTLSESRRAIADARDEDELLEAVCRVAADAGGYRLAWVGEALRDANRTVRMAVADGDASAYVDGLQVTWDDSDTGLGPTGTAIRTGEPFVSRDVETDPRFEPWREKALSFGLRASAALPIDSGSRRYGSLNLYAGEAGRFDEEEVAFVVQLAASVGNGIEALRLRDEREHAYADLRAQREQLEDVVDERTADLKAAIRDLEEAVHTKDQFLRSMSHELRTPLNSIIGFSQVLLQGLGGPLTEEQITQLRMVNASGRHLLELVSEILDLSRIEAGDAEAVPAEVDVRAVVTSVTGPLRVLAEQKGLGFEVDASDDALVVMSDEARLRRILLNLVGNAIKFTDSGSVRVEVDATRPSHVMFNVIDTGCGIAKADLPKILQEFRQVPRPDGMKPEGTGLGLAISTRLATAIGGRIDIESRLGKGSTFTLVVPRETPARVR